MSMPVHVLPELEPLIAAFDSLHSHIHIHTYIHIHTVRSPRMDRGADEGVELAVGQGDESIHKHFGALGERTRSSCMGVLGAGSCVCVCAYVCVCVCMHA